MSQCDGDWEHSYGVKIYNVDNPGWTVVIDLAETEFENSFDVEWRLVEKDSTDWYGISVKNNYFKASGDPSKLQFYWKNFEN